MKFKAWATEAAQLWADEPAVVVVVIRWCKQARCFSFFVCFFSFCQTMEINMHKKYEYIYHGAMSAMSQVCRQDYGLFINRPASQRGNASLMHCTVSALLWLELRSYASAFLKGAAVSMKHINGDLKTGFLRITLFSGTERWRSTPAFSRPSNCHNVCAAEQTFASITSVCFHNKYSYIITQLFSNSADLDTKGNWITCHGTRWESKPLSGGVSTMKPLLNFDGKHSYISTRRDRSFPPQIAGEL